MNENVPNPLMQEEENQQEDLKRLLFKYLQYWRWFVIGVAAALVLAFLFNRYATNVYQTDAEIKILKEKENGIDLSGLDGAASLFSNRDVNLENEIEVLKSRRLLDSVVHSLKLNTTYLKEEEINTVEVWDAQIPFEVHWQKIDSERSPGEEIPVFKLHYLSATQFEISVTNYDTDTKTLTYNQSVELADYKFKISSRSAYVEPLNELKDNTFFFSHRSTNNAIDALIAKITIAPVGKESDILSLSYQGSNKLKNQAILDTLISKFNTDGMRDKRIISKRTEDFIAERLVLLSKELDTVETGLVNYKEQHGLVTIESTSKQLFEKELSSEAERFQTSLQRELAKAFKEELLTGEKYSLLPANLGLESSSVNDLTKMYNETVLERNELLLSATPKNPAVQAVDSKLDQLKGNILQSVNGYISNLSLSLENFEKREALSSGNLHKIPQKEKAVRAIMRQQEIKEKLYLFLLQKREEAALQYATTSPSIKVVDYAYSNPIPVSPKKKLIYLAALILGALIPFGILYIKFLLDTKIGTREDIERVLPNTPVLAEVPELDKNANKLIKKNDLSVLAEAFRILRTNLGYFKAKSDQAHQSQVIFVTSTIKGEGKTFTALNTAHALAATGKKVLMIGCDLRNPQTHNYYNKDKNSIGVSAYLNNSGVKFDDLLNRGDLYFKNLDLIIAGQIPPNPAELLINGRFEELIAEARERYDYVIVDTAPTILVTDTLLISQNADVTLYMTRSRHTDIRLLNHIKALKDSGKLKKVGIVLNGVSEKSGYGYGYSYNYGYGYGYSEDAHKRSWKFWKK